MPRIKILDQDLVNKIAAGEVVERPASVVKELIENSLDAGALNIEIEIEKGGSQLIKVIDDGKGMSKEDARLSLLRYATSKISNIDDLFNIRTLGFRGEALASISAVSRFKMHTKKRDDISGTEIIQEDNQIRRNEIGARVGTVVTIRDLFYNVPARKKFLKSVTTEFNHILDLFNNFSLLYPEVNWKILHNQKLILHFPSTKDWLSRVKMVIGSDIASDLVPVSFDSWEVKINGYIAKPAVTRNNKKSQFVFINNRPVREYLVSLAARDAYSNLIPRDQFPVFVLKLDIEPKLVDVNVHPRKTEVKFVDTKIIYNSVYNMVSQILYSGDIPVVTQDFGKSGLQSFPGNANRASYVSRDSNSCQALNFTKGILDNKDGSTSGLEPDSFELSSNEEDQALGGWKLFGQVKKSYLLVESDEGLIVIDQHAAAERILYEKIKKEIKEEGVRSQNLLLPINIELSTREVSLLKNSSFLLKNIGFSIDEFVGNSFVINAVPATISNYEIKPIILGIVNDLEEPEFRNLKSVEDKQDIVIKYTACRSAVKFNDKLDYLEQIKLLKDIRQFNVIACPHGRPCYWQITWNELGKKFKR